MFNMLKLSLCAAAAAVVIAFGSPARADTTVTGAGATFPYPMYSKWFDEYHKLHPEIQINYQSIGSGGGIAQVTAGTVDFGASDGPMNDEQIKEFKSKQGSNILHFPTVLGADVPTYNVPGVKGDINFTPEALAGIFLGKIKKWNDPAIQNANPDLKLPDTDLIVVHRSDGSGTTYIWVDYLSKISPEWKEKVGVGTSVKWPVGLGAKGNEGVTQAVAATPGTIGYVELIYAVQKKIPYGPVKNSKGNFVKADLASVTAAASAAATNMPADFRVSITNPEGEKAYPISSFTWLLVPDQIKDDGKRKVIVDFLKWMMEDGQKLANPLDYAQIPDEVVKMEKQAIEKIK